MEPNTNLVPFEAHDSEVPDSEPPAPLSIESDWAPIMEFTAADIFQHSPFGDVLNSLLFLEASCRGHKPAFETLLFDGILRHDKFVIIEAWLVFGGSM